MEQIVNDLIVKVSSLERQIDAIKTALVNIKGFYVDTADGSQQGLLKYGVQPVDPEPVAGEVV